MAEQVAYKVVAEVVGSLLTKVKKEIGYMCNCEENVKKLWSEVDMLEKMNKRVEQKIKLARETGDDLVAGVEEWVNEALAHISTTEKFLLEEAIAKKTGCNLQMCVNLRTLHHCGKKAINMVPSLEQHQTKGADLIKDGVSIPAPVLEILDNYPREDIVELDTHKSLLEKISRSVLDENIQITGIYGMGGVGKTTLATQVAARVKDQFALVVFVTVSQNVDAASIKKQVETAAKRIDKGEKVLIIMDDVWTELKLHDLGIPCGTAFPNCKILLTSRETSVLKAMKAQEIRVGSLLIEEAHILFERVVGETDAKLKQVMKEIVEGCGGLPLIIQAVGKALKHKKNIKEWENARDSIQKHKTSDIDEDIELEFAHLRLSYDYLRSEDAKSIFLLCCMFPEDFDIPLEQLAYYGVGLELFEEPYSLEDARNKVQRAVKILKSSCLLLDGKDSFGLNDGSLTKMHDVVREVALLIASKGDNKFLVEAGKNLTLWEPRPGSLSYTGISLMGNDICKLPAGYKLNIPLLKIFLIQRNDSLSEISDEFIQAVKEAKVIDFEENDIISLPKSLKQLKTLRMLNLGGNKRLCDVSLLGELEDLEILILNETGIKKIPQEIGKLVKLRLFHAARCPDLSHIEPGVLANLRWLEELSIGVEEGENNSLVEISKLSKLTYLNLWVKHICLIPEVDYLKRLKRFSIQFGGKIDYSDDYDIPADRRLMLDTLDYADINSHSHVRKLIEVCNGIFLRSINNLDKLDKIMPMVYCEGFGIKTIYIRNSANLLYLVDSLDEMHTSFFSSIRNHEGVKENILSEVEKLILTDLSSLKVIWNCQDKYISLNNLVTLWIYKCPKLKKLFSVSVAQGLVNLKVLIIWECKSLTEVISDGDGETSTSEIDQVAPPKTIVFDRLVEIRLIDMVSLTSFYPGNATIEYPSLVKVVIRDCNKIEKWGYGTHNTPKLQFVDINFRRVNGSTIDEALAKNREAVELEKKQRHDKRLVSTEEGSSSVSSSEGEE